MAKTSTVDNDQLEHTAGGVTTRDEMDAGVPMTPGHPDEPVGPEDALGAGPKRGDYSDRIDSGPHMVTEVIPAAEREPDGPLYRLVPADRAVSDIGDAPGKGGVSTEEARAAVPAPAGPVGEPRVMRETAEDGSGRAADPAPASAPESGSTS